MRLVLCYNNKRQNSTLQINPFEASHVPFNDIKFRAPTSLHNPVFTVRTSLNLSWSLYNYAVFYQRWTDGSPEDLNSAVYLWVEDIIVNTDGTVTVSTKMDVLACHKDEILNNSMFVTRSQSTYNSLLIDSAMPVQVNDHVVTAELSGNVFANNYTSGTYIVGLMNNDPAAVGIPHYYAMTYSQWTSFCTGMLNTVNWANIDESEMSVELQKALINPMQYITSAMWLPCIVPLQEGALSEIPLGYWTIPVASGARRISGAHALAVFTVTLPQHPEITSTAAFLDYSPYSVFRLNFEPFGEITMPAWVKGGTVLTCRVDVDPCTGDGTLHITAGNSIVGIFFAKVGVEMQIGQASLDVESVFNRESIAEAFAAGAMEMFQPVGDIQSALSGVVQNVTAASTAVQSGGTRGSISAYQYRPYITANFKNPSTTNYADVMGRPLCRKVLLDTLSGFVLCSYGNVQTSASPAEKAEISSFLTSGFYIE